jgi:hypothetical protein
MGAGILQVALMFPEALFKRADSAFQETGILLRQTLFRKKLKPKLFHGVPLPSPCDYVPQYSTASRKSKGRGAKKALPSFGKGLKIHTEKSSCA